MVNHLLALDMEKVEKARQLAKSIALKVQEDINLHTTVSVERTVARLFGIDGTNHEDIPLANVVVDQVYRAGCLDRGVAFWIANAVVALDKTPQQVAEECSQGLRICGLPMQDPHRVDQVMATYTDESLAVIAQQRQKREALKKRLGQGKEPLKYVIVASGNIFADVEQAKSAARHGVDIIAQFVPPPKVWITFPMDDDEGFRAPMPRANSSDTTVLMKCEDQSLHNASQYCAQTLYAGDRSHGAPERLVWC